MTKEQLEKDRDKWKNEAEDLQSELNDLNDAYSELESELAEMNDYIYFKSEKIITDIEDFISRLKIDGLYTDKLGAFIENYMKFYNIPLQEF